MRKEHKWIARPLPGPHKLDKCITLNIALKDILKYAKTTGEVKYILNNREVLVNKVVRKDYKFPIGFMDVLEIPKTNEHYRVLYDEHGYFVLRKISKEDSKLKPCKIIKKLMVKGGKQQITLHDGNNIFVKDKYQVGDTVVIDLEKKKIIDWIKLEKDNLIYLVDGKHVGSVGVVSEILSFKNMQKSRITFKIGDRSFETLKDYVFVIGKKHPVVVV
ncbi:MAG: 30S ribosomal protein S4e [Nanoarchaeota archaeon]